MNSLLRDQMFFRDADNAGVAEPLPAEASPVVLRIALSLTLDSNGEDPEFLAQRMNSAIYQALVEAGLTKGCPDSQAVVVDHSFVLRQETAPSAIPEWESTLLAGDGIGAGDAMALYDMPETVQEGFAAGWNRRHELAGLVPAAPLPEIHPSPAQNSAALRNQAGLHDGDDLFDLAARRNFPQAISFVLASGYGALAKMMQSSQEATHETVATAREQAISRPVDDAESRPELASLDPASPPPEIPPSPMP